jgi:hypothetical protein
MQLTFKPARLTGFAILAVAAATALSVGACSSSKEQKPSASSTSQSAQPQGQTQLQRVHGLIASVSGNTVQVNQKDGTAAVDFSPTTKVDEVTPAQFSDVANGNCVTVASTAPAAGGAVTAKIVNIVPAAANGKCAEPKAPANPAPNQPLRGTVASVAGDTITVSTTDVNGNPSQTPVKVDDKTRYNRVGVVDSGAIAQGKCITAAGKTKDANGALQATAITLAAANNGKC